MTLEEVDYLFTKEGKKGVSALTTPALPVQESLKDPADIEKSVGNSAEHSEGQDEKTV